MGVDRAQQGFCRSQKITSIVLIPPFFLALLMHSVSFCPAEPEVEPHLTQHSRQKEGSRGVNERESTGQVGAQDLAQEGPGLFVHENIQ